MKMFLTIETLNTQSDPSMNGDLMSKPVGITSATLDVPSHKIAQTIADHWGHRGYVVEFVIVPEPETAG